MTINRHTHEEHTNAVAAYLPGDRTFEAKNIENSNLRKLIRGLSVELVRAEDAMVTFEEQYFPDGTEQYVPEWERVVAIPDGCFSGTGTIEERRAAVLTKLTSLGIQTAQDFIDLAAVFGKAVNVVPLRDLAYPPYDVPFYPTDFPEVRYVFIVEGENLVSNVPPYDVPFDLIVGEDTLACLFKKLKPANTEIVLRNTN